MPSFGNVHNAADLIIAFADGRRIQCTGHVNSLNVDVGGDPIRMETVDGDIRCDRGLIAPNVIVDFQVAGGDLVGRRCDNGREWFADGGQYKIVRKAVTKRHKRKNDMWYIAQTLGTSAGYITLMRTFSFEKAVQAIQRHARKLAKTQVEPDIFV